MIADGMSNKGIARSLGIAPETVKSHAKNIFVKLASRTRAQAVARAELENFPGAIDDLTYAISLRPGQADLLSQRGWLYIVADAPQLALNQAVAAVRAKPVGPIGWRW